MTMPKKAKRRGPGRPRLEAMSGQELRLKAIEGIKRSSEKRGLIDYQSAEDGLQTILDEKRLKKATHAELNELRRMAAVLWEKLQCEKQYEEDLAWEGGYGVNREPTPQSDAWDAEHKFLEPKRANAKKTKTIYDLTDKQKQAKGMSLEPVQPEFDIEMTEADLENVLMQEALLRMEREKQHVKGRRVSGRKKVDPEAQQRRNFWH